MSARHPNYSNTKNGLALYYPNNSKAGYRGTVRRNRINNTISKHGIRYINEDIFIKHYPEAIAKEGSSYQLSMEQVNNLPDNI